jgi:poly(hydroxyalkanoate) granule-associated protein
MVKREKKPAEEKAEQVERNPLLASLRKVLLAGIGAVALAQDEAENLLNRLVERGEIAEADARKLVQEVKARRQQEIKKVEEELDKRVAEVLQRMNVPTKADLESLSAQIAELTRKVEKLRQGESAM